MQLIIDFFEALFYLSNAMAPYILFGLIVAGILHEIVPQTYISRHLGSNNIGSVIKATFFGIPLPVCSCGVIPLATSVKKSGASRGATLAFLIATPITGVDSILATYGVFGWLFTLYRFVTSIVIAIVAGILVNIFTTEQNKQPLQTVPSCCQSSTQSYKESRFSFYRALTYAFVTLLEDIIFALFIGLLVGAALSVLLPTDLSEVLQGHRWLSYTIAIAIAVPMYVCATSSLPIAAGLLVAGISPGAAFVFLTAGPATNSVTIGVVKKMLGTKTLIIYLGTIIVGSVLFGLGLDNLFMEVSIKTLVDYDENLTLLSLLSTFVLWALIVKFLLQSFLKKLK